MTRVHDMGGRFGDGAVVPEPEEKRFHADWHARALAVTLAAGALGRWNLDMSRFARESVPPGDYMRFSYYEKWMAGLADLLVESGEITPEELAAGDATESGLDPRALRSDSVPAALSRGAPTVREGPEPAFAPGQAVRVRRPADSRLVEGGHTRLPAYAAGATGTILRCHGCHILPDAHAHGLGEAPEPLYSVAFEAAELWAAPEGAGDEVVIDLWESYLDPA